jgi:hypothetical protein
MPKAETPDLFHRRAAIQIVAQLPETQADALLILEAAREFVLKFLAEDQVEDDSGRGVVLSLVPVATDASELTASERRAKLIRVARRTPIAGKPPTVSGSFDYP